MSERLTIHSIAAPVENVVWSCIDNEAILLNLENGFYYTLNDVGCKIWELIDGKRAISGIGLEICSMYAISQQQVEQDLCGLFQDMLQEKLITIREVVQDQSMDTRTG